jgi:hypothetical protein
VGPRTGLDVCEKSCPTGIRSPDRPACSLSLYRLSYQAHVVQIDNDKINIICKGNCFYMMSTRMNGRKYVHYIIRLNLVADIEGGT